MRQSYGNLIRDSSAILNLNQVINIKVNPIKSSDASA